MADRVRRNDYGPISQFAAKWLPELPASRLAELEDDIIMCAVEHTDPIPGSPAEVRAEAVRLMDEFLQTVKDNPGMPVDRDMLMEKGMLIKGNRSDQIFTTRFGQNHPMLNWNPATASHFVVRQLTNGHDDTKH